MEPQPLFTRTRHHELALLTSMEALWAHLLGDLDAAKERIWVETYIYRDDETGRQIAERLARAVTRGVEVCLLFDDLGSQETDRAFFSALSSCGVQVRPYRPLTNGMTGQVFPPDHSPVLCIDDVAYAGGFGFGNEWLRREDGGRGWHDVACRVRGPVVTDFDRVFERRWREALHRSSAVELEGRKWPDLALIADSPTGRKAVFEAYRERIACATKRVWIENAYFLPPRLFLADLTAAAARGVDVQVIVPAESDLKPIERAARAEYASWLDRGIKLYEFLPSVCHGKYAVVDDDWTTIGTLNLNVTSLWWSNEANLFVFDRSFAAEVARMFERDRALCRAVQRDELRARSWTQRLEDRCYAAILRSLEDLSAREAPLALPHRPSEVRAWAR